MLDTSIQSNAISWHTIDKEFDASTMTNESSNDNSTKGGRKIKRRTKILNRELKKFAGLKSYSQYVRIKVAILRNISDNEDTDDDEIGSPPLSPFLSSQKSDEETSFDILSQSVPSPADDPSHLPSSKVKSAQAQRKVKNANESNSSRIRLKNNKIREKGDKFHNSKDDTRSSCRGGKNIGKLRECSSARRNLTSLLESLDDSSETIREAQSTPIAPSSNFDNSNNNNNNNRESQNRETKNGRQMTNLQPRDSGIDDDSQDNLSINNRAKDIIVRDKQKKDGNDLESRTEILSVDDRDDDVMLIDADNQRISEISPEKEQESILIDENLPKKSQPTITCTELVKSKYKIIREENETENDELLEVSSGNNQIINDEEIIEEIGDDEEIEEMGNDEEIIEKMGDDEEIIEEMGDDEEIIEEMKNDEEIIEEMKNDEEIIEKRGKDEEIIKKMENDGEIIHKMENDGEIIEKRGKDEEINKKMENDGEIIEEMENDGEIIEEMKNDEEIIEEMKNDEEIIKKRGKDEEIIKKMENDGEIIEEMENDGEIIEKMGDDEEINEKMRDDGEIIEKMGDDEEINEKMRDDGEIIEKRGKDEEIIEEMGDDEEIILWDRMSPETRRVSQMKRMNLLFSGTESDSSQDDEIVVRKIYSQNAQKSISNNKFGSQVISEPSDSDESVESIEASQHIDTDNSVSLSSLPLEKSASNVDDKNQNNRPQIIKLKKKSIKSQIEEQETDDEVSPIVERKKRKKLREKCFVGHETANDGRSMGEKIDQQIEEPQENLAECCENTITKIKERSVVSNSIRPEPTDAESLEYVLNHLPPSNNDTDDLSYPNDDFSNNNDNNDENGSEHDQNPDETLSRPIKLRDFIARHELIPNSELSTIAIDDLINSDHEDDEIWLMEIPRMIASDPQLCGKNISLDKTSMRIGETSYDVIRRREKFVSCILRTGNKKKARYRTVNLRPVGSIVVHHQSTQQDTSGVSKKKQHKTNSAAIGDTGKIVPFPKNLKSRNPLMAHNENKTNDDKKIVKSPSNETRKRRTNSKW